MAASIIAGGATKIGFRATQIPAQSIKNLGDQTNFTAPFCDCLRWCQRWNDLK